MPELNRYCLCLPLQRASRVSRILPQRPSARSVRLRRQRRRQQRQQLHHHHNYHQQEGQIQGQVRRWQRRQPVEHLVRRLRRVHGLHQPVRQRLLLDAERIRQVRRHGTIPRENQLSEGYPSLPVVSLWHCSNLTLQTVLSRYQCPPLFSPRRCTCPAGYVEVLGVPTSKCVSATPCTKAATNPCGPGACSNTGDGSYSCSCNDVSAPFPWTPEFFFGSQGGCPPSSCLSCPTQRCSVNAPSLLASPSHPCPSPSLPHPLQGFAVGSLPTGLPTCVAGLSAGGGGRTYTTTFGDTCPVSGALWPPACWLLQCAPGASSRISC